MKKNIRISILLLFSMLINKINIAQQLMIEFSQCRVSVTTPDRTYMLTNTELVQQLN
jgi:hypothetical protein